MTQNKMKDKVENLSQPFKDAPSIIKGDNLHKTYLFGLQGVAALRGVSVDIKQGEFVIILGNSGGGKTSLLNILGTIDRQTKGNLQLYGQKIKQSTSDQILSGLRLNHLGFVFQTFNLISTLTAKQNVQLPMILKGELSSADISRRAQKLLDSVGMSHRLTHFPNQLSGGQQQRVTIARALANEPKMLLLDQPTGDLDSRNTFIVLDILLRLNIDSKITLIMVTHDVNIKYYSDRVLKVLDGKIIGQQFIDPKVKEQHLIALREKVRSFHQMQIEGRQSFTQSSVENRKVEVYGAIKWLRQKQIREKIQKQMIDKVRQQLSRVNMNGLKQEVMQQIQQLV